MSKKSDRIEHHPGVEVRREPGGLVSIRQTDSSFMGQPIQVHPDDVERLIGMLKAAAVAAPGPG
jgi:hypothetical protein